MSDEVIHGLSADSKRIPSRWTRNTVADGSWLQNYTLSPLSARDFYLASAIDANTDDLLAKLEAEIEARKEGDNYISGVLDTVSSDFYTFSSKVETSASTIVNTINEFSANFEASASYLEDKIDDENERAKNVELELENKISTLEAATDVIMVYGTYSSDDPNVSADTFVEGSALLWENPGYLTENDVIKVLIDNSTVSSNQTYYKATNVDHETSSCDWTKIGSLEPYYSTWAIDDKFTDAYEYLDDNFLKADNTAVSGGHNIVVDKPNENIPAVRIQTSSHVTFTGVSSTDLSATNASGTNLNYSKVSATNLSSTTISATTAIGESAIFTGVSAQGLTATDFNVDNIKAKNVSASESFSGKKITIETSAKIPGISATNISGESNTSTTIKNLILSAQAGSAASDLLSTAYWSANNNGTAAGTGLLKNSFSISAGANLGLDVNGSVIRISGTPAGVTSISAKDTNVNTNFTGGTVTLSAGPNIDFVAVDTNTLGIKLEDSIYWSAGVYNDYTSFSADFSSLQIKHNSQYNGSQYISFSGDKLNLYTNNASQSQGTSSATLDSNGVCAFDNQAGSTPYYSTWIDIISGTNLQNGNYVYIDRTLNTVNLSSNISANNISAGNISATYLSAFNINQEYVNNTYTARLSSNADSVEMWQHTQGQPGNTTGIAKWAYIIRNNETRNGTMAKMNSGDYISGNGSITAIVSGTVGAETGVLYFV